MKIFTIKNSETGVVKGYDLEATTDLVYFDAIQDGINENPDAYSNEEIKAIVGGWDMGIYADLQNELDQISEEMIIGRYAVTPLN